MIYNKFSNLKFGFLIIFFIFFTCKSLKEIENSFTNGFYYGRNNGFVPQTIVYCNVHCDYATVECFYPLKGEFFLIYTDSLKPYDNGDILFKSDFSKIYREKNKFFYSTTDKSNIKIQETRIRLDSSKKDEYRFVKEKSRLTKERK